MKKKRKSELTFDELNSLDALDTYYEPMQIGGNDKQRRRELAGFLADAFLFFFTTFEVQKEYNSLLTKALYTQMLADKVSDAVSKVTGIDSYMSDHIREMSKQVVNTTFEKVKNAPNEPPEDNKSESNPLLSFSNPKPENGHEYVSENVQKTPHTTNSGGSINKNNNNADDTDTDYWLSYKRAEDIAKSEANTFLNYTDYVDAKESGKTKKTWLTMLDDKVRLTHSEVEGQTIDIDALFYVGDSLMRFPHDLSESPNPKEVIGCRCSVQYS